MHYARFRIYRAIVVAVFGLSMSLNIACSQSSSCDDLSHSDPIPKETAIKWTAFTPELQQSAHTAGKYVLIHAYATWTMSVVVDYHTLKTDPIIQSFLSRNRHIIETLAVDCTERSDYLKAYEQLGIESVSTTMLIAPNGSIVWETRWIADAKVFVDKIDAVINGRNKP